MIFRRGVDSRRPSREQFEQEASDIIDALVASGRPPPEVWRKAEEWRAANPPSGTSWYPPASEVPVPAVSSELRARTVRLPAGVQGTPARRAPSKSAKAEVV